MTAYNSASRTPEGTTQHNGQTVWRMVGFIEGYNALFNAADKWVRKEYHDLDGNEEILQPRPTLNGLLPIALGKFTTYTANNAHIPSNERNAHRDRLRLSKERQSRLVGFLQNLDVAPAQIYLIRQTRAPQLIAASLMIARPHIPFFDAIRGEQDILPKSSGLRYTQSGDPFIGTPIATPLKRELWPSVPLAAGDMVHGVCITGGYIERVPVSPVPQQRTPQ